MQSVFSRAMQLLVEVPKHGKLAYCLMRDERVPAVPKAALIGALTLILSPIDLPAWVPLVGELDMLALAVLAVETFIEACPEEIRHEHQKALDAKTSVFDRDLEDTFSAARSGVRRIVRRVRNAVQSRFARETGHESYPSLAEG